MESRIIGLLTRKDKVAKKKDKKAAIIPGVFAPLREIPS